jgi:PAS domain S-box-containing protein
LNKAPSNSNRKPSAVRQRSSIKPPQQEVRLTDEALKVANEKLAALNQGLERKNQETESVNGDLFNLLASAQIALLILGNDKRICRFTVEAGKIFSLTHADVGRFITEVAAFSKLSNFPTLLSEAMNSLVPKEIEMQDDQKYWWLMRIRPYKTIGQKIDGVALILVDINRQKQAEEQVRCVVDSTLDAVVTMQVDGTVTSWNPMAAQLFGCTEPEALGQNFQRFVTLHDRFGHEQNLESCLASGDTDLLRRRIEVMGRRKGGHKFPMELAFTQLALPNGRQFGVVARDITERKAMERAQERSNAELEQRVLECSMNLETYTQQLIAALGQMQDLYQSAPCGYHSVDANGMFIAINDTALGWLGYQREHLVGRKTVFDIQTEASRRKGEEAFRRLKLGKPIQNLELEFVRKDGSVLAVSLSANAILDDSGRLTHTRSAFVDITDRVRAEKALAQSEAHLQAILDWAPATIFLQDLQGRYLLVNREFEKSAGFPKDKVIGRTMEELDPGPGTAVIRANDNAVLQTGQPRFFQETYHQPDGSVRTRVMTRFPLRDAQGQVTALGGVGIDVTEKIQVETALRRNEAKFRSFVESAPDAVIGFDETGRIHLVNGQTERLFGYAREELLGGSVERLFPVRLRGKYDELLKSSIAAQRGRLKRTSLEWCGRNKNGIEFPVEISASPLQTDSGAIWCASIRDATARKRMENDLRQSKEHYFALFKEAQAAHRRMQILSRLVVGAQERERKHLSRELHDEVGQELTAVSLALDALHRGHSWNPDDERRFKNTQHLLRTAMATVHDFARELRPSVLDELGLVPALRSALLTLSERTGLHTRLTANPAVERLSSEEKLVLFRVSQESLNNVVKHAQASRVRVTLSISNKGTTLVVADNGKSFKPKRDGLPDRQRLGLLGMAERVRLVKGKFEIHARPGKGTTVEVLLPTKPAGAGASSRT